MGPMKNQVFNKPPNFYAQKPLNINLGLVNNPNLNF